MSKVFVVTAYRWGHRDNHSYVVGCSDELEHAKQLAESHMDWRGGKYGCEVVECDARYVGEGECGAEQVHYVESPYYGACGRNTPSEHPADRNKPIEFSRRFVCMKCHEECDEVKEETK